MVEVLQIIASWLVTIPLVVWLFHRDEGRLAPEQRARAWPRVSRDAAIFAGWNMGLPHLCVPVHFWRTRRSALGLLAGFAWTIGITAAGVAAQLAVATVAWALHLAPNPFADEPTPR
jgi:hypothetical protein